MSAPVTSAETPEQRDIRRIRTAVVFIAWAVGIFAALTLIGGITYIHQWDQFASTVEAPASSTQSCIFDGQSC
jgi:hypothetical protein